MKKNLKWLLVGPGDIANSRVAPALMDAENSEFVAICGRRGSAKTQALAEKTGITDIYDDLDQALAESGADAVYIATPHHLHVEMCRKALLAEKHVFCEKPLGIQAEECLSLLELVRSKPELATGCSNYRLFTNQFRTAWELIQNGTIGELVGGWAQDEENYYNPAGAPLLKKRGASPVHYYGFYLIDLARAVFGMPRRVTARFSRFKPRDEEKYDIDDYENILLEYEGGKQFTILLNTAANAPIRHSYEFSGTAGRILMPECPPHFNSPVQLFTGWQQTTLAESVTGDGGKVNWHLPMVQDFVDAVLAGRQPFCTLENAVRTAVITDAVIRSAETGTPVDVRFPGE